MIEKVEVVDNKIVFTFNTSGGGGEISIPFQDLFSLYTADNGINIKDSNISIKKSEKDEGFLQLDGSGLYIKGINQAIADKAELLSKDIEKNLDAIETLEENILKLESDLRKEYEDADTSVKSELNKEITTTKELLQEQINSKVLEEQRRAELKESDLSNQIDTNRTNIETLQGDVTKEGSVKHMIADAPEGLDVVGVTPESVRNFSLIRKLKGTTSFYVSSDTNDMIHQQKNLKVVIDELQITENTLSSNITQLTNFYNTLNDNITALSARIAILENNLAKLEEKSITSITGTGQEIKVTPINNNTVQIGFADDAEFIAG
jgi:predicted  nucleic acid-binding Zn-ribbon protein